MTDFATPVSYAKHLASYISDPSTIRAHVKTEWGRAPSIDIIRKMMEEVRKPKRIEGYSLCESRYRPLFKCGHPETANNIVIGLNGIDKCKACEDRKWRLAKQREDARQARIRVQLIRERMEHEAKLAEIKETLAKVAPPDGPKRKLIGNELIAEAARFFNLTHADVVGEDRHSLFVDARCVVSLIMKERGLSFPQIGRFLKRDHSSIINLVRKAPERMARNPSMLKALEALR